MDGAVLPELLIVHRQRARLTQEQLAERAGVSVRTVRNLEAGRVRRPHRASLRLLAAALGLSGEQHAQLVSAVPAGGPPEWTAPSPRGPVAVPAQLPADVADFTGRQAATGQLGALLTRDSGAAPTAMVVSSVAGRAGVGKTALAVHAAHEARAAFPDGQLHVNLRGAEAQALDPSAVLARFLQALGVQPNAVPQDAEERASLYRSLVVDRRVLVLLDNAASEAQVRPLLPAGPGCAVLVTSRRRLAGLEGARRLDLDVLDEAEALTLLGRVAGPDRLRDEPAAAIAIVGFCGRLPLAVRIAGARLAARPEWSVSELAERLADERGRLSELTAGDLEVRASAALSYQTLSPDARRAFGLLGLLDAPDFAAWVAAAMLDVGLARAQGLVDDLVDAQLLDEAARDGTGAFRYRFHDLLRVFARELAHHDADADAALGRALSGWLTLTEDAERRLPDTSNSVPARAPRPWSSPPGLAERLLHDPLTWFEAEQQALVHAVEQACRAGLIPLAWELAARVMPYFIVRSLWEPWRHTHELTLEACRRAGDHSGEATMLLGLGTLAAHTSDQASTYHERALALFREAEDAVGEARTLQDLSVALRSMTRFEDALEAADQSLLLARRHDLCGTEMDATRARGGALLDLGRLDESVAVSLRALSLLAGGNARRSEAQVRWQLACARRAAGDLEPAARLLEESLHITRELLDRYGEALVLIDYAQVQAERGLVDQAERALTTSVELGRRIAAPSVEAPALLALGRLHLQQEEEEEGMAAAQRCFVRAAALWDALGNTTRAAEARAAQPFSSSDSRTRAGTRLP